MSHRSEVRIRPLLEGRQELLALGVILAHGDVARHIVVQRSPGTNGVARVVHLLANISEFRPRNSIGAVPIEDAPGT